MNGKDLDRPTRGHTGKHDNRGATRPDRAVEDVAERRCHRQLIDERRVRDVEAEKPAVRNRRWSVRSRRVEVEVARQVVVGDGHRLRGSRLAD